MSFNLSLKTENGMRTIRARAAIEKNPAVLQQLSDAMDELMWQASLEDPWFFLRALCKTENENPDDGKSRFEPFPDKPYLKALLARWLYVESLKEEDKLHFIPKSRQMMVSWFACAMVVYWCLTGGPDRKGSKRVGWQGKKASDTDFMLERMYGIWERLPECVRKMHPCEKKFLHLHFPSTRCNVHAIPQGDAQVRQFTWSLFILDEMAFNPDAEESYYALLPALGKNGMAVAISTAGPGTFEELVNDKIVTEGIYA